MKNTPRINLNVYVLEEIFKHLTLEQRSRCARVCRAWYEAESYIKIRDLRVHLGLFKVEKDKGNNFVFVKSKNQLNKIVNSPKFINLTSLTFHSFKNSSINTPAIDLRNFGNLIHLNLNGFFYNNNIFVTLLDNKIKLEKLMFLSAPIIHVNLIQKIFPNLKHVKTNELLTSTLDCHQLEWTKLEYYGSKDLTDKINYLNIYCPLIEELTLTVYKLSFLSTLQMNNLKRLHINCIPENLKFVIEQIPLFLNTINERELEFKVNGLPLSNLEHADIFILEPFRTSYNKLSKSYHLNRDDREYFLNNFKELEILNKIEKKIKLFKGGLILNNLRILNFDPTNSPQNLIDKIFTKVSLLEQLEIGSCEKLGQDFFNSLPERCSNLMSIGLKSSVIVNFEIKFVYLLESLTSLSLQNFNLNINADFKHVVKRIKYLNDLKTFNTFYNHQYVFKEFQKKASKYPQIQFKINIDNKHKFSNFKNWNNGI